MIIRNSRYKQVLPDTIAYKGQTYTKAYAKGKLLFANTDDDYEYQYFTVESLENGNVITFTKPATITTSDLTSMSYSTDGGATWTTLTNDGSTTQSLSVSLDAGDKAIWKGTSRRLNNNYGQQHGCHFTSTAEKQWVLSGNIMSLLYGDDFYGKEFPAGGNNMTFYGLFCTMTTTDYYLVDASNFVLPAKTLKTHCYTMLFKNNTGLVHAPKMLPAEVATTVCYYHMFYNCTSLEDAPYIVATSLVGQQNFYEMFRNCAKITHFQDELFPTTLTNGCYAMMFYGCSSLEKAPKLPATTLTDACYRYMFYGCTSLTEAPELPAATLTQQCYQCMLQNCTNLNYIKCLATDISATNCTDSWVRNVASTGTFIKADSMNNWVIDSVNGIPIGWTLHNYENCTVTLSVNNPSYGNTTGAGTYHTGDMVTIKANAADGYRFVGWYDGSTLVSQNEGYTFEIWTNVSYQAVFEVGQVDYSSQYFTIESLENECEITISHTTGLWSGGDYVLNYSKDNGANWNTLTFTHANYTKTFTLNNGEKALIRNMTNGDGIWCALGSDTAGHMYINGTKRHIVYGNIMSMFYGSLFTDKTTIYYYACPGLFWKDEYLIDATNLIMPATTLTPNCYNAMFKACKSLIGAPALPATTLANNCYSYMFHLCTSLTQAPSLPATTMTPSCYYSMFRDCYSLTAAPTLSATTLADSCYEYMFRNCYALTGVPSLPATTLEKMCYYGMFDGCSSLTDNVALYATTLAQLCYNLMFRNTKIERLSVYAASSSWSIDFGTINTVPNPPVTGVYFVKPNATSNILNACPTGWTISKTL